MRLQLTLLLALIFCFLAFAAHDSEDVELPRRLSPTITNLRSTLTVDGTYSQCATLPNRLFFVNLQAHRMTWRHLWNYMSILVLALETLNPSHITVVRWKRDLDIMLARLQKVYLPGITEAYDYQVDSQMVIMVYGHLQKLIIPTDAMAGHQVQQFTIDRFVSQRVMGTTYMFRSLFEFWETPTAVVQLLARSYMPYMYLLHMVHDANQVHDYELLTTFYSPIHHCIAEFETFSEIGDRVDYEIALTYVDSHLMSA